MALSLRRLEEIRAERASKPKHKYEYRFEAFADILHNRLESINESIGDLGKKLTASAATPNPYCRMSTPSLAQVPSVAMVNALPSMRSVSPVVDWATVSRAQKGFTTVTYSAPPPSRASSTRLGGGTDQIGEEDEEAIVHSFDALALKPWEAPRCHKGLLRDPYLRRQKLHWTDAPLFSDRMKKILAVKKFRGRPPVDFDFKFVP